MAVDFAGMTLDPSRQVLRYGENSHQRAALYVDPAAEPGLAQAEQLHGKEMSYNNYVDAQAAYRAAYDFTEPAVAIIKHANPCGIAIGRDVADAHAKAHACDPVSAFGGVIATNRPVTVAMAEQVAEVFTEVIVAPSYDEDALDLLTGKKNMRLLVAGPAPAPGIEMREISGGVLLQEPDRFQGRGRRPGDLDVGDRTAAGRGRAGRPGVRVAGLPGGEVERDPAGFRRSDGRRRDGSGQPGRLGAAGGLARG